MAQNFEAAYRRIINPESIVVVGASENPSKPGGSVTKNLIENNYPGKLYLINKAGGEIRGVAANTAIDDLPDDIDLGLIVIPAPGVYQTMHDLGEKNCKTVIVMTAGFGETDEKGKAEEKRLIELAEQKGMTMIGPNCVGIVTPYYRGKFAGIIPGLKRGTIDMISASGATVDYLMEQADSRGLKFDNVISLGNSAHYGVEDMLELLDKNHSSENAPVKFVYLESIKKPRKLLKHARSLTEKGCILVGIKSGVTDDGQRAAASHTGAMASSDISVQALFEKAGIIRVRSKYELVEIGCALNCSRNSTDLRNVSVITDAGGPGVMLTDELNKHGLSIPKFREETQQKLAECLPMHATVTNPVDCLPTQTGKQISDVVHVIDEEKEDVDAIVVLTGNSMLFDKWECYSAIAGCMDNSSIPVLPVLSAIRTSTELIDSFKQEGRTFFVDEVKAGKALGRLGNRPVLYKPERVLENYDKEKVSAALGDYKGVLPAEKCADLLDAAGFKQPGQVIAKNKDELSEVDKRLGWPVAVKVIGTLHKSDVGGVIVGVENNDDLEQAWENLSGIDNFEGVLVQKMAPGGEVIIGANKEP
ncbi:MAG: CoA-binding protein, partial [Desulfobacteraceae bacterium]|nr:CoA-binding protein [Desulfobacteraceae bacterium]